MYYFIFEKGNLILSAFPLNREDQKHIKKQTTHKSCKQSNISQNLFEAWASTNSLKKMHFTYLINLNRSILLSLTRYLLSEWIMPDQVMLINPSLSFLLRLLFKAMKGAETAGRLQLLASNLSLNETEVTCPALWKNV